MKYSYIPLEFDICIPIVNMYQKVAFSLTRYTKVDVH